MYNTYAEYELSKVDRNEVVRVKFRNEGGGTRWLAITPDTLAKIEGVLKDAPECSWEA